MKGCQGENKQWERNGLDFNPQGMGSDGKECSRVEGKGMGKKFRRRKKRKEKRSKDSWNKIWC